MRRRAVRSATRSWVEGSGGTLEEGEDGVAWVEGGGDVLEEGEDGAGTLEDGGRVAAARWRRARTAPDIREERVRVRWD